MIDLTRESPLTLAEATRLPFLRNPHLATVYRWAMRGVRGVKLETVQIGGSRCTTREAVLRFIEALTGASAVERPEVRTPARRQRENEAARERLAAQGIA